MARKLNEAVIVTKIKAYPIPVKVWLSETNPPLSGQILRVTKLGFQMEIQSTLFKIGEQYKVEFTLPLYNKTIAENIKIIKTMDRYKDSKATLKEYIIEMHFLSLSKEHEKAITQFETAINQKL